MRGIFRPRTRVTTYQGVGGPTDYKDNARSHASDHPLSHTIADLERYPRRDRCCQHCNTELPAHLLPSTASDPRLRAYASEFIQPLVSTSSSRPSSPNGLSRPSSPASTTASGASQTSHASDAVFVRRSGEWKVSAEERDKLRVAIEHWRDTRDTGTMGNTFLSRSMFLPPRQLEQLVDACNKFLGVDEIMPATIRKHVKWASPTDEDLVDLGRVISDWRRGAAVTATPHRTSKRPRVSSPSTSRMPVPQPVLQATPQRSHPPVANTGVDVFGRTDVEHTPQPARLPPPSAGPSRALPLRFPMGYAIPQPHPNVIYSSPMPAYYYSPIAPMPPPVSGYPSPFHYPYGTPPPFTWQPPPNTQ